MAGRSPMPCIDDDNSYRECFDTLKAKCPEGLFLQNLIGMKSAGRGKTCMWVASYSKRNNMSIPRIEAREAIEKLQRSGNPEDGLLKVVGHSRLDNLECIFGEWRKTNCNCGFFRLLGDGREVPKSPKYTAQVIQQNGLFRIPLLAFTTNDQKTCIADISLCTESFSECSMGLFLLMACSQWEAAVACRDATDLFFVGRFIESNAIVLGGGTNYVFLSEYADKTFGIAKDYSQAVISFSIDEDSLELLDMYGESDGMNVFDATNPLVISCIPPNLLAMFTSEVTISPNDSNEEQNEPIDHHSTD